MSRTAEVCHHGRFLNLWRHDVKVSLTGTGGDEMFKYEMAQSFRLVSKFLFKMTGRVSGKISAKFLKDIIISVIGA